MARAASLKHVAAGAAAKVDNLASIQVLRWLAATLVVVGHSQQEMGKIAARVAQPYHPFQGVEFGAGVDIFFVISGFLMYHVSAEEFGQPGAPEVFLKRRFIRIVPLYWIMTSLMLLAMVTMPSLLNHSSIGALHVLMSYLMVAWPNTDGFMYPVLALGWTLNCEVYFYVAFALALAFRRKGGVSLLCLLLCSAVALNLVTAGVYPFVRFYGQPIVLEFVAGLGLAVLFARGLRLPAPICIAVGIAAVIAHLILRNSVATLPRLLVNGFPAAGVFTAFVFCRDDVFKGRVGGLAQAMGDSSYSLYLTHPFALNVAAEVAYRLGIRPLGVIVILSAIVALAIGYAGYHIAERPLLRTVRRWMWRGPRPAGTVQALSPASPGPT